MSNGMPLKPSAFTGGFQNDLAGFKMVQTTSNLLDGFKVVWVSNRSVSYILVYTVALKIKELFH